MRLYLSSFKLGNSTEKLLSLVGANKKAVVILNALDYNERVRKEYLSSQIKDLTDLGFEVEELDLLNYFGNQNNSQDELKKVLSEKGLVWVCGGNTFVLRREMKQSGFDLVIKELLAKDSIAYAGFSAGVCVITPTMKGLEITDDPNVASEGYEKEIIWEGLGLIDYSVAVHYQSDHEESHLTDKEIEFYKKNNMPYKTLRDGEVIIYNGDITEMLS